MIYNKLLRTAKSDYFRDQIELFKGNMKQTWATLRNALNSNNVKTPLPEYFKINNKITDKKKIAEEFNKLFANIGHDISNDVPLAHHYSHYMNAAHNQSMFLNPINQFDVIDTASKIKAKTSQGHDQISCKLMKETIAHIALPLAHIINQSFLTGVVSRQMKIAKVIPVFKCGDKHTFNN